MHIPTGPNAKCKRFINVNNSETLECPGDQAKKNKHHIEKHKNVMNLLHGLVALIEID